MRNFEIFADNGYQIEIATVRIIDQAVKLRQ